MAEAVDSINCSICQDQLKDPVTIPCGHSYCMGCIKDCLDQEDDKGIYSCPQCRQTFTPRPVLNRSTILSELVENLKKTKLQSPPPGHYSAGPGDVECDFCTGRKLKAVKSCLVCLASYCETHLQPHYESPAFKKHKLVQASTQLQEKICSHHDKLLEVFCRTDQQCICLLCVMDEHKGHETVSATTERAEKQEQLEEKHQKSQMRIQETEEDIQQLRQAVDSMKSSAQTTVDENEKIFSELIQALQRMHSEMNELIRAQEKAEVSRAEGLLEQLELELAKRKRIYVELKQLSNIEDHIHFLQSFQSLSVSLGSEVVPSVTYNHHSSFEHLNKSISELKDQLQELCKEKMYKISGKVTTVRIERPADPKTREDFLTYSCQLTLDLNTANQYLCLSEGNSKVTSSDKVRSYPYHPDRFTSYYQVLCREGLFGADYWELEWSGKEIGVAVSYKEINRKGDGYKSWIGYNDQCRFGYNDQSWRLSCSSSRCCFFHNNTRTDILVPCSSRVGVYLDHRAGTLSFYSVSDTMTLLHRVQTTFTEPLYPGFYANGSVNILTPMSE